jgi:hypothetical protein
LISSSFFKRGIDNNYIQTGIYGKYSSQLEIFAGLEFFLQKKLSLNVKYTIPLKTLQYSNIQITLNIYLDKESFKRKDTVSENAYGMKLVKEGYIEDNGIIYPATISDPPKYGNGSASLYQYLEDNIRVIPKDYREYGNDWIVALYELKIDTLGKVTAIDLAESRATSKGRRFQVGHLSNEIIESINNMKAWKPATINGKNADVTFYLPLVIELDMNKIIIHNSQYLVPFKNRKK